MSSMLLTLSLLSAFLLLNLMLIAWSHTCVGAEAPSASLLPGPSLPIPQPMVTLLW